MKIRIGDKGRVPTFLIALVVMLLIAVPFTAVEFNAGGSYGAPQGNIKYHDGSGSVIRTDNGEIGGQIEILFDDPPVKSGYAFMGWSETFNSSTAEYTVYDTFYEKDQVNPGSGKRLVTLTKTGLDLYPVYKAVDYTIGDGTVPVDLTASNTDLIEISYGGSGTYLIYKNGIQVGVGSVILLSGNYAAAGAAVKGLRISVDSTYRFQPLFLIMDGFVTTQNFNLTTNVTDNNIVNPINIDNDSWVVIQYHGTNSITTVHPDSALIRVTSTPPRYCCTISAGNGRRDPHTH